MFHERTRNAAHGKWRGILLELGVPAQHLRDRHGPCPICGGTDRFRWDNRRGDGTWICNQCGAGDGLALAMAVTGKPFAEVAAQIDSLLGNIKFQADQPKPEMTEERRLAALRRVAAATVKLTPGCLADIYLRSRKLGEAVYPKALRFAAALPDGEGSTRPAMVATVQGYDGANVTLHRTFLRPDGGAKAEMERPRKLMPGEMPERAAVRLAEWSEGVLGVAEGIETALAAGHRFECPVWATVTAGGLAKWWPPEDCREVAIFADHDVSFTGHAAAYRLANRLAVRGVAVTVHVPPVAGEDWADVWMREAKE